jgi:hypothetical protein
MMDEKNESIICYMRKKLEGKPNLSMQVNTKKHIGIKQEVKYCHHHHQPHATNVQIEKIKYK